MRNLSVLSAFASLIFLLAGCNFDLQDATPTVDGIIEEPIVPLPDSDNTDTPTPSASPSPIQQVRLSTPSPFPTLQPTETPIPTETPGPWEYEIQQGDVLTLLIQRPPFNYRTMDVLSEIVRINDNIPNADSLPGPGNIILSPRPTATPIPEGIELTQEIAATRRVDLRGLPENTEFDCHIVQPGEVTVGIVEQYGGLTLELMSQLNADINFSGCNFEEPGGGPSCNPVIREGQCILVPMPTPTPTLSPTPSGDETPTPTPTYPPARLISPPEGALVPPGILTLQWTSVGVLQPGEYYLVEVVDTTAETIWNDVTRSTNIRLPDSLIPSGGEAHQFTWNVSIATINEDGTFTRVQGIPLREGRFNWQSR